MSLINHPIIECWITVLLGESRHRFMHTVGVCVCTQIHAHSRLLCVYTRSGNSHVWEFINVWAHRGHNGMGSVWKGSHDFIHVLYGLTDFLFRFLHISALEGICVKHLKVPWVLWSVHTSYLSSFIVVVAVVHFIGVVQSLLPWLLNPEQAQISGQWDIFMGKHAHFS